MNIDRRDAILDQARMRLDNPLTDRRASMTDCDSGWSPRRV
jgi:hypothetical protein